MIDYKKVCVVGLAVAAPLIVTGCFGSLRYVDHPTMIGHSNGWVIEKSCMTEGCSPEAWRLTDGDIKIDMMPRRGTKQNRYFSIWIGIWSDTDTRFTYAYEESYAQIMQGEWIKAKVPDTRKTRLGDPDSMRNFFRQVPAYTGIAEPRQLSSRSPTKFIDMTLFFDTEPPLPGMPFVIRLAGLNRNGNQVQVPDVEFRFRAGFKGTP
jgi:hypothetical protein